MPRKDSQKEIEEAQKKVRGEAKPEENKPEQKKDSLEKAAEKVPEKKKMEDLLEKDDGLTEEKIRAGQEQKPRKEADLEDIARKGAALPAELHDSQYVEQLSHKPMTEIYKEIKDIYRVVEDKGYLSPTEQKQVEYLSSAVQRKFEDEEQGIYSFSQEAARAASVTQQLSSTLMGSYKRKKEI
ncbi:MAG: hypothetical protein AABY40_00040 [Nanoarchaeota archaeon]